MLPRTLLRMSLVVTLAFIACLAVSGCGKKEKAAPAKMPQVSKEPSAAADTADIFKEFYSDDSTKKKAGKSKKAAKQETFSPSSPASSVQPEFSAKGRYTVQITCVRSKSFADNMTGKMKDKGYPAYVAEVQNPTPNLSGTFYRVRIGGFSGLSAAKSFGENTLVPGGYQYWVDKKSNDNVGMEGYGLGSGSAGSNAASSYDNVPAASPAPAAAPSSSYESPNSTYSSPSSASGSSGAAASGSSPSTYQPPATTTTSATAAPAASSPAPASSSSSTASPAPAASSTPAASSSPAASSAPAGTQSQSSTSATTGTTGKAGAGGSAESGWGTDSTSKSGW